MDVESFEKVIEELETSTDETYRETVLRAVAPLLEFHREVLEHIIQVLRQKGQADLVGALVKDPIIATALRGYALVNDEEAHSSPPPLVGPNQTKPSNGKLISIETLLASTQRNWLPLLHENELKEGEFLRVQILEEEVLVWMSNGRVFACKNHCPQGGGSVAPATSDGVLIVCPCHGYHFNLRSGECAEVPELKLEILPVSVESNVVRVAL